MTDKDCKPCVGTDIVVGDPCFGGKVSTIDYCIPTPSIDAFSYEAGMGVLRTAVATGHARQRRLYTTEPRTYDLTWVLTTSQLNAWESFAQQYGYGWHFLPMVTGQVPDWFVVEHPIRYIDNYQVTLLQKDLWEVSVQAEQHELDTDCMLDLLCDKLRKCLAKAQQFNHLPDWDTPIFPPVNNYALLTLKWGDDTKWVNPNG